jgi:hypothetical protein
MWPLALPLLSACCPDAHDVDRDASFYVPADMLESDLGAQCAELCATYTGYLVTRVNACDIDLVDAGVAEVSCAFTGHYRCIGGRRPHDWIHGDVAARGEVAAWLAAAAQLEAASVPAFEILADELRAHAAPPSLVARARASADDERRHARVMASLARAHGATPGPVRVVVREPRALEAIARENAVEGLVREAYGARVAIDPAIGADEQRHAELAADVHAWIRPRLPYAARRRVDEARDLARAELVAECAAELPRAVRATLGLPDATRAVELARRV